MFNHLTLRDDMLAKKVVSRDLAGFFSTKVEIMEGSKALVFENGRNCGELGPGKYTLASFIAKFMLTTKEQIFFSYRDATFKLPYETACITKEFLNVKCKLEIEYKIENSTLFIQNLIGNREMYTLADFKAETDSLMISAIQEAIAPFSVKDLGVGESRQYLVTALEDTVRNSLARYGISFKNAVVISLVHEHFDAIQNRKAEMWLVKEGLAIDKEEREAKFADRLDKITAEERLNDIEILEKQVGADRQDGELAVIKRRLEQKKNLRKLVQANTFDKVANKSEMEQFLYEQEKAGVLLEQEKKDLLEGINWVQEEKELRRAQFLKKLDIQFQHELEKYQTAFLYQTKLEAMDQEIELARKSESEENRKYIAELEKAKMERQNHLDQLEFQLQEALKIGEIKLREHELEIHLAEKDRVEKVAVDAAELDHKKQLDSWEIELQKMTANNQIEKLTALEKIREMRSRRKMEFYKEKQAVDSKIEQDRRLAFQKFTLDVIQLVSGMEPTKAQACILSSVQDPGIRVSLLESYKITASTDQLKIKTEADIAKSNADAEIAKARAEAEIQAAVMQNNGMKMALDEKDRSMEQMQQMMKQMMEMQERNADRFVQMNSQSVNAMGNMNNAPVVVNTPGAPAQIINGGQQQAPAAPQPEVKKVFLCPQCRAEVDANLKYCPNCGKQL